MATDRSFLGTGWSFPPAFDPLTRAAALVSREEDIAQSLEILLSTVPGERVMHPTFGCGLKKMVFEEITDSVITELKDLVRRAILFFEPRITLEAIDVEPGRVLEGELYLRLVYTIRTTNARANLVYPLYLYEGSEAARLRVSA